MHPKPPYKTDDLYLFCCQNPECQDYGLRNHGNLTVCGVYGPNDTRLLRCRTCRVRFSERKGTVLFNSKLDPERAESVLEHINEGCGARQTSRLTDVSLPTILRLIKVAGKHAQLTHDELVAFSPTDK